MIQRTCFVVMPFRPDLNFFFLYLQKYLSEKHNLRVQRGDTSILTRALMDKIESEIRGADLIIGDISFENPNVFYELGFARANRKPIIFLTQEDPEKAPVDVRQFEFIRYDLAAHQEFLSKLDNAVRNVLGGNYSDLYEKALLILRNFNKISGSDYGPATLEEFQARVVRSERLEKIPGSEAKKELREFLLPKIVDGATDMVTMRRIDSWLTGLPKAVPPRARRQKQLS